MKKETSKVVCYDCKEKSGSWCKKFSMPIYLALQNGCHYGINMTQKKEKRKKND